MVEIVPAVQHQPGAQQVQRYHNDGQTESQHWRSGGAGKGLTANLIIFHQHGDYRGERASHPGTDTDIQSIQYTSTNSYLTDNDTSREDDIGVLISHPCPRTGIDL